MSRVASRPYTRCSKYLQRYSLLFFASSSRPAVPFSLIVLISRRSGFVIVCRLRSRPVQSKLTPFLSAFCHFHRTPVAGFVWRITQNKHRPPKPIPGCRYLDCSWPGKCLTSPESQPNSYSFWRLTWRNMSNFFPKAWMRLSEKVGIHFLRANDSSCASREPCCARYALCAKFRWCTKTNSRLKVIDSCPWWRSELLRTSWPRMD